MQPDKVSRSDNAHVQVFTRPAQCQAPPGTASRGRESLPLPINHHHPYLPGHSENIRGPKAKLCSSHQEACAGELVLFCRCAHYTNRGDRSLGLQSPPCRPSPPLPCSINTQLNPALSGPDGEGRALVRGGGGARGWAAPECISSEREEKQGLPGRAGQGHTGSPVPDGTPTPALASASPAQGPLQGLEVGT